ncbi:hypothetical protein, partial [Clostridium beijerinckii]|uniref:hypothetical protein n=1 Tax=Clostridium beijerinckii TaxID=1520 RepID=UPI001A9A4422
YTSPSSYSKSFLGTFDVFFLAINYITSLAVFLCIFVKDIWLFIRDSKILKNLYIMIIIAA